MKKILSVFMALIFTFFPFAQSTCFANSTDASSNEKGSSVVHSAKETIATGAVKAKKLAIDVANSKPVQSTKTFFKKIGKGLMDPMIFSISALTVGLGWFTFNGVSNRSNIKDVFSNEGISWNKKAMNIFKLVVLGNKNNTEDINGDAVNVFNNTGIIYDVNVTYPNNTVTGGETTGPATNATTANSTVTVEEKLGPATNATTANSTVTVEEKLGPATNATTANSTVAVEEKIANVTNATSANSTVTAGQNITNATNATSANNTVEVKDAPVN